MKTNSKHKVVSRIAPQGMLLVGLLATALTCVCAGQSQSTASASAPNSKPVAAAAKSGAVVPLGISRPASGLKSGVKVHGYWKIDVKNPDGRLASHTEFENSLTTGDPNGLSGDDALSLLLSGGPSEFRITAAGVKGGEVITKGSLAGLIAAYQAALTEKDGSEGQGKLSELNVAFPYLVIGVNTNGFNYVQSGFPNNQAINYLLPGPCGSSPCATPTSQSVNGTTISLSTTFGATAQSTISEVGTFVSLAYLGFSNGVENGDISLEAPAPTAANYTFTSANLAPAGSCGGAGQPPCQVSVSPGQTVSVSVALSFN
jgi:hypothetical protein